VHVRPKSSNKKARVAASRSRDKLKGLVKRPGMIVGDSGKLAEAPTFDEAAWRKKWDKRLKRTSLPRSQGRVKP
jgi:hypothetical protein